MRESDIRTRLSKLPKGLMGVYDEIINSIKSQPDCNFILATRALKWMLVSKRPLRPQELVAAAELNPSRPLVNPAPSQDSALALELLIQSCEGFLVLDTALNVVRFSHFSAQEYLDMQNEMLDVSLIDAQRFVSESCLWTLQSPLGSPLYEYAAFNWFRHCRSYQDLVLSKGGDTKYQLNIPLLNSFLCSFKQASTSYSKWGLWIHERVSWYTPLFNALSEPLYPAFFAAFAGLGELVRWLWCQEGNDMSIRNDCGSSLLGVASEHGTKWIMVEILKRGAAIEDVQDALCLASKAGNYDTAKLLLDQFTDINVIGGKHGTALGAVAFMGQLEAATLLLDYSADVNIIGGEYGTALGAAAFMGRLEVATILLDHGADVNIIGGEYGTALGAAAIRGQLEVATLLLDRGADVNRIGGKYGTALAAAAFLGKVEVATLLLDRGADVNIIGGEYGTALGVAVITGQLEVATLLLDHGADVNIIGGEYGTALCAAALMGWLEVATLLLNREANPDLTNSQGSSPRHLAKALGHEVIVNLLDSKCRQSE